jgi:glucose/arabinose dehydrogenase
MRRPVPPQTLLAALLIGLAFVAPPARALPPGYTLQLVQTGLEFPTTIRFAPDGRLFYTELFSGRIMVFPNGTAPAPTVWATVPVALGGERGLQGMAFHPDFPDSPFVYVFHTRPSPTFNCVARLRESGGVGVDYTILLDSLFANAVGRFGGRLAFGPDRLLYVTIGDCTTTYLAQEEGSLIGKILRLGLTGKPAPDNPYGPTSPVCAIGVRNPFGFCFDPVTGYGYFTDNGPLCDDELNRFVVGVNYGWGVDDFCGGQPAGTYLPMATLTPTLGVTGCTTYRGTTYPSYDGNLFFGGYNDGSVRRVVFHSYTSSSVVDSIEVWATVPMFDSHVLDVTQGPDGRIWFSTFDQIWRVLEPPAGPVGVDREPAGAEVSVVPNPSDGRVTFRLQGDGTWDRLELVDAAGRRLHRWDGPLSGTVLWDGRFDDGREAAPGIYWVRGIRGGRPLTRRVVRIAR